MKLFFVVGFSLLSALCLACGEEAEQGGFTADASIPCPDGTMLALTDAGRSTCIPRIIRDALVEEEVDATTLPDCTVLETFLESTLWVCTEHDPTDRFSFTVARDQAGECIPRILLPDENRPIAYTPLTDQNWIYVAVGEHAVKDEDLFVCCPESTPDCLNIDQAP